MPLRRLGPTTLLAIMIQRTSVFFGFSALSLLVVLLTPLLPAYQADWIGYILPWMVISSATLMFTTFLAGWLEYKNYRIILTPISIGVKTGVFGGKQMHIPYRLIRSAKVVNSRFSEGMGVRGVLISLKRGPDSFIFLPMLEKHLAEKLQRYLLTQSQKPIADNWSRIPSYGS